MHEAKGIFEGIEPYNKDRHEFEDVVESLDKIQELLDNGEPSSVRLIKIYQHLRYWAETNPAMLGTPFEIEPYLPLSPNV